MLDFIYRLVRDFELEHGVHPNLLYLNRIHTEHLQSAFDESYSLGQIMNLLQMDMIIDSEIMHPQVAWTLSGHRVAS